MLAPCLHQRSTDESHLAQYPADHWQFEDDTHHERHRQQRIHIRLQGQHIRHILAHLIGSQKLHRQGEDQEIVEQCAKQKHRVSARNK